MLRQMTSPVPLPDVPMVQWGGQIIDEYGNYNTAILPAQYLATYGDDGGAIYIIYDDDGGAAYDQPPPYRLPAGYWIWQQSDDGYWHVQPDGYRWAMDTYGYIPSSFAIQHNLTGIEGRISRGLQLTIPQIAFLESVSSVAPVYDYSAPGRPLLNAGEIWNDFVTRVEDREAPGDFLGIDGIGTPDDWGPTIVIASAVTAGAFDYFAEAAEGVGAATEATEAAGDFVGDLPTVADEAIEAGDVATAGGDAATEGASAADMALEPPPIEMPVEPPPIEFPPPAQLPPVGSDLFSQVLEGAEKFATKLVSSIATGKLTSLVAPKKTPPPGTTSAVRPTSSPLTWLSHGGAGAGDFVASGTGGGAPVALNEQGEQYLPLALGLLLLAVVS